VPLAFCFSASSADVLCIALLLVASQMIYFVLVAVLGQAAEPQSDECWYAEFGAGGVSAAGTDRGTVTCHSWCEQNYAAGSFCVNNACGDAACCCTASDCPGATAASECSQEPRGGWDDASSSATSIIIIVAIAVSVGCPAIVYLWWLRQPKAYRQELWNRRLAAVGLSNGLPPPRTTNAAIDHA
jgi:hypothetical protein